MKKLMRSWLLWRLCKNSDLVWQMAGHIASRFHDTGTGEYDMLEDRMYDWLLAGMKDIIIKSK